MRITLRRLRACYVAEARRRRGGRTPKPTTGRSPRWRPSRSYSTPPPPTRGRRRSPGTTSSSGSGRSPASTTARRRGTPPAPTSRSSRASRRVPARRRSPAFRLLDDAAANARATTITWVDFLERVRNAGRLTTTARRRGTRPAPTSSNSRASPRVHGPRPPASDVASAQARIFLAHSPLDCLAAPPWMVPVCTADAGYREWYTADVIAQLRAHFGTVEAWCDCRPGRRGHRLLGGPRDGRRARPRRRLGPV